MKILKGDTVYLRSGKDVAEGNRRGTVLRAMPDKGKVVVGGLNMITRHQKPRPGTAAQVQSGGRIKMEAPLPVSRVMLVCPSCDKPTRVGMQVRQDVRQTLTGEKTVTVRDRVCKHCGATIPRPADTRQA